jgi:hypothetical protein
MYLVVEAVELNLRASDYRETMKIHLCLLEPGPCETSNKRAAVYDFRSVFGHYRRGGAKKVAPIAPFSDNLRVSLGHMLIEGAPAAVGTAILARRKCALL